MSEQQKHPLEPVNTAVVAPFIAKDDDTEAIDLTDLFFRLLANWKLILGLAVLFAILTGLYTQFLVTPKYEATSTIYVLSRKDSAINMADLQIGAALTQDYIKVFDMWEVHEQVISDLSLPYTYKEMRANLSIVNTSNTRMLDISYRSPSAEEAAQVANEYARVACDYIADTMSTDKPNIMSIALTPTAPVSPNKTRNILLGFILGGFLASAIVTVRFITDDKYKTAEDIRRYTGLNTLAALPDEDLDDEMDRKNGRGSRRDV